MTEAEYINSNMEYGLEGLKHPLAPDVWIMEKWEQPIITKSIQEIFKKLKSKSVLEVGFGYGYTASAIQAQGVDRHLIVEAHPQIYQDALNWKKKYPSENIEIINKFIQNYSTDEQFDLIYDDRQELVYIQEGVDWSKFNYTYLADCYTIHHNEKTKVDYVDGFWFICSGKSWYQPLIKKE